MCSSSCVLILAAMTDSEGKPEANQTNALFLVTQQGSFQLRVGQLVPK